jgi:hypothetical protein
VTDGSHVGGGGNRAATPLGHPLSDGPLPFGKLVDVGLMFYDEVACSRETLSWMQATGIPSDRTLQVVEECVGGFNVIVKAWRKGEPGG